MKSGSRFSCLRIRKNTWNPEVLKLDSIQLLADIFDLFSYRI